MTENLEYLVSEGELFRKLPSGFFEHWVSGKWVKPSYAENLFVKGVRIDSEEVKERYGSEPLK